MAFWVTVWDNNFSKQGALLTLSPRLPYKPTFDLPASREKTEVVRESERKQNNHWSRDEQEFHYCWVIHYIDFAELKSLKNNIGLVLYKSKSNLDRKLPPGTLVNTLQIHY